MPAAAIVDENLRAVIGFERVDGLEMHHTVGHEMRPVAAAIGDDLAVETRSLDPAASSAGEAALYAVAFGRKLEAAGKIDARLEHEFEPGVHGCRPSPSHYRVEAELGVIAPAIALADKDRAGQPAVRAFRRLEDRREMQARCAELIAI